MIATRILPGICETAERAENAEVLFVTNDPNTLVRVYRRGLQDDRRIPEKNDLCVLRGLRGLF